jgi:hypothetical protein
VSFGLDLKAFADSTNEKANAAVRQIIIGVDEALVERSPVGNPTLWKHLAPPGYVGGRFRANWQYAEREAPGGMLWTPIVGPFPAKNEIDVAAEGGGKIHYLVNNLPYAQALEDGHSTQAPPAGIVSLTVIEFEPIVKEAVAKL